MTIPVNQPDKYHPNSIKDLEKQIPEEIRKEVEKVQNSLKDFKKEILKKYKFIDAIGVLPPLAAPLIEEEEPVKRENEKEQIIHVVVFIPHEKVKEENKIKADSIKLVEKLKPRVWIHVRTNKDVWDTAFDGKYNLVEAYGMSFPLYDKGLLGALRLTAIHKKLTLQKFERYVTSYVIAGSFVRGDVVKTSDIDVYVIVDDTDVKRMSRFELKEKLRAIILNYAIEAEELSGIKGKLNVQIYILTEFWESVKDAHPVIFTLIRDGVPLYDRGAFMPWKLLLKMGKIKPSPEAIDMFMAMGDKMQSTVKRRLLDIVMGDIYWGVITPSQAMLMLKGLSPPTPKETVALMRQVFCEKEKLLEKKYIDILENILIKYYKGYEHGKVKEVTGAEVDKLLKDAESYTKRLKELMAQIEKKAADQEITPLYHASIELLKHILGSGSEAVLMKNLDKELVKTKKVPKRTLSLFKELIEINKKKAKATKHDLATMGKVSHELNSTLHEYVQRKELIEISKNEIDILYGDKKKGQLFITKECAYLIPDLTADELKKIDFKGKVSDVEKEEFKKAARQKADKRIPAKVLTVLKKLFGEFELVF
ncbi:MAG: nucleotidyltransferase domain-containing protein [archaeon]